MQRLGWERSMQNSYSNSPRKTFCSGIIPILSVLLVYTMPGANGNTQNTSIKDLKNK